MTIETIIQESIRGNPLEMKEALVEELKSRISEALAAKMEEVKLDEAYTGHINWTKPNSDAEHHEVHYQVASHEEHPFLPDWAHKRLTQLKDKGEWNKAMKNGKSKVYSRNDVKNTNNTGDKWSEVEKDGKKRRAPTLYSKDKPVQRSIVLKNPETGERHLIGGHHRATYVTDVLKRPTEVHEIT